MAKHFTRSDWYDSPLYYDIVFDQDTGQEATFLEEVWGLHGRPGRPRVLEPACGGGRLLEELALRGYDCTGFDLSRPMLDFARERFAASGVRPRLFEAPMEEFSAGGKFGLAFCLLSSFKYLRGVGPPLCCLRSVRDHLVRGGLLVLGIHLTDYRRTRCQHERWVAERGGVRVVCNTRTWPPDRRSRTERLRNRLTVTGRGVVGEKRLETVWDCRTYDARQLRSLIRECGGWEVAACYDYYHDVERPREIDDSQEDLVVVLRKE